MRVIDFEAFRAILESAYSGFGRPPVDCVVPLKLELLERLYWLSDREVMAAARFNIAYQLFLGPGLQSPLPHPTVMTYFRNRQGAAGMTQVFDNLVGQARNLVLVKGRLRLKDATHIITNIAVPSTIRLVHEEETHGNKVEAVSIAGAGFPRPVLRELTGPDGLNLEVFTSPSERPAAKGFPPEQFSLQVIDGRPTLTCPLEQTTTERERNPHDRGYRYRFREAQCSGCPQRGECLAQPNAKVRTVIKNDYKAEYTAARAKAQTPEYARTRKQHPAIERKLSELVRRHDMRHACYRGQSKVLYQGLLTSLVVNLKRIVRLLATPPGKTGRTARAEAVASGT